MDNRWIHQLWVILLGAVLFVIGVVLRFGAPSILGGLSVSPDSGLVLYENQQEYEGAIDVSRFLMVAGVGLGLVGAWSVLAGRKAT